MNVIEIANITKKYRINTMNNSLKTRIYQTLKIEQPNYLTALNKINFSIQKGEIFGLLGPNGAGKTTLIKILAGLLIPDEGTAVVNDYNVIKDREKVRTSINILMSGGWIIFDYKLSIYNNLKFWGIIEGVHQREIKENVEKALTAVGLFDRKDDFPENLSAGLRQKMNLARCLLSDRPIYLLDEPTSSVDPYSAEFIRLSIQRLKKEGKTIVLATHNLWEAELLCDRLVILNRGEVLALDTPMSLKKKIGKEILVLDVEQVSSNMIDEISSFDFVEKVIQREQRIEIFGDMKTHIPTILDTCKKYTSVIHCDIKESSLNDIFLQLVDKEETARMTT